MSRVQVSEREKSRRARIILTCGLVIGLALLLAQFQTSWARPQQNALRDTIDTPVPSPTKGPTSTGTPTKAPGIERVLLQEDHLGYSGTRDTWLNAWDKRNAQPLLGGLEIKGGEAKAVLIRFDLTGQLPPGAHLVQAELVFYVEIPAYTVARELDISAFRVLREWEEDKASWQYVDADAKIPWGAAGCDAVGQDRVGDPDDTITLLHRAVFRGLDVTDSVGYWLQHPDENYGWLVKGGASSTGTFTFDSSRSSMLANRPVLRIDYTVGEITPTATATTGGATATWTPTPISSPTETSGTPTTTPQPTAETFDAVQDTYIDSWYPDAPHNIATMYCRSNGIRKPLVQFDLSSLPAHAQVTSATLSLTTGTGTSPISIDVAAHRLLCCWQENSATWQEASTGQPWGQAGASGTDDYDPQALDVVTVDALRENHEFSWDVTAAAQEWVQGGMENCGLILIGQVGNEAQRGFHSSESPFADMRPRLFVEYSSAEPTPASSPTPTETLTPARGSILVTVYEDVNRNAWPDVGEQGLADVVVELLDTDGQALDRRMTLADGTCTFVGLTSGRYRLREHDPWGYLSSTENEVSIYIGAGQTEAFFGDYPGGALALPLIVK